MNQHPARSSVTMSGDIKHRYRSVWWAGCETVLTYFVFIQLDRPNRWSFTQRMSPTALIIWTWFCSVWSSVVSSLLEVFVPCVDSLLRFLSFFESAASGGDGRSTGKTSLLFWCECRWSCPQLVFETNWSPSEGFSSSCVSEDGSQKEQSLLEKAFSSVIQRVYEADGSVNRVFR